MDNSNSLLIWLVLSVFLIIFIGLGVFYGKHFDQGGRNVRMETLQSFFRILKRRWAIILRTHYLISLRGEQDCSDLFEEIEINYYQLSRAFLVILDKKCSKKYQEICQKRLDIWKEWTGLENKFETVEIDNCCQKLSQCNRELVIDVFGRYQKNITISKLDQLDTLILQCYYEIYTGKNKKGFQSLKKCLKKSEYICTVIKEYILSEYK